MNKLSPDKLAEGISFHNGSTAQIYIEFSDDSIPTVSNFIAKYEQDIDIMIQQHFASGFIFQLHSSSSKDIARICAIMNEDLDIVDLEVLSIEDK